METRNSNLKPFTYFGLWGLIVVGVVFWLAPFSNKKLALPEKKLVTIETPLYTNDYPVANSFKAELTLLRGTGRLPPEKEIAIHRAIALASSELDIPRPILWCLFFQESRLDHLLGLYKKTGIVGLGQFSKFGFLEINEQTNRFEADSLAALKTILGSDVRPIKPHKQQIHSTSSYFNIPTAVTASSIYLNNRYYHLEKIAKSADYETDHELLWLFAAMAYNKGTRSVLALWKKIEENYGQDALKRALKESEVFLTLARDEKLIQSALNRIWKSKKANAYAKEWFVHFHNIKQCSVNKERLIQS